jgi:hypothetical protein
MRNLSLVLIVGLFVSGCGAPPPPEPHIVSREDIIDFCDSIPSDADRSSNERDIATAKTLHATDEQAEAMARGAADGRITYAFDKAEGAAAALLGKTASPPRPFVNHCRERVREELAKLKS